MHAISIEKIVGQDWERLFDLVLDVERYPQFVPGCTRDKVLTRQTLTDGTIEIISRMTVGLQPLQVSYCNRTIADRTNRRITVHSTESPLRHLNVQWRFIPTCERSTHVRLAATYEFRGPLLTAIASGAFDRLFAQMIEAFERRAGQLGRVAQSRDAPAGHAG